MGKSSFHKSIMYTFVVIAFLAVAMTGAVWIQSRLSEFDSAVENEKRALLDKKKTTVRADVEHAQLYIQEYRFRTRKHFKTTLSEQAAQLLTLLKWGWANADVKSSELLLDVLKDYPVRCEATGFFVLDSRGEVLFWKKSENTLSGSSYAADIGAIIPRILEVADNGSQKVKRIIDDRESGREKQWLVAVNRFEPLGWYVGTIGFPDEHDAIMQKLLLKELEKIYVEQDGRLFGGTWEGLSLLGPAAGKNVLKENQNNTGSVVSRLIDLSRKGGGFIEYEMPPVSSQEGKRKLSYVAAIPEWGWYLGAGIYIDDIDQFVSQQEQQLEQELLQNILTILGILAGLLFLSVMFSRIVSSAVGRDLIRFSDFITQAGSDEVVTDPDQYRFKEFSRLATASNKMVSQWYESQARFQRFSEYSPIAILICNKEGGTIYLNSAFTRLLGYTLSEVPDINHCFEKVYPDEDYRQLLMDEWQYDIGHALEQKGQIGPKEVILTSRDGSEKTVEISAAVVENEVIVLLNDITERIESEEAQQRSERLFRIVFDNVPVGIMLNDQEEFRIIEANHKMCELVGLEYGQLIGRSPAEFAFPEDVETIYQVSKRIRENRECPPRFSFKGRRANGEQIDVETIATGIFDEDGDFVNGLALVWDETERNQLREQLKQSEKLQAIGQLAGGIAHDFNNQLGGILGFAELLMLRLDNEQLRDYAKAIMDASQRAGALTSQLLAFARKGKIQSVTVDLQVIISDVIAILSHTIDKRIEIQQHISVKQAFTKGDPAQIQNALLNMAINARDAMKDGGVIDFSLDRITLKEGDIVDAGYKVFPGEYLKLSISDTGVGISDEVKKRIFEPFFTTKPAGQGTGMGLAAVYGTAKAHMGYITVDSKEGKGSCFEFYLPLSDEASHQTVKETKSLAPVASGKILLVDDEKLILDVGSKTLADAGYDVKCFSRCDDAIEFFQSHWKEVSLIVLDMIMPGKSGLEAWHAFRKIDPDVKVIISSGFSVKGDAQQILNEGGKEFLQKPFRLDVLKKTVAKVLLDAD